MGHFLKTFYKNEVAIIGYITLYNIEFIKSLYLPHAYWLYVQKMLFFETSEQVRNRHISIFLFFKIICNALKSVKLNWLCQINAEGIKIIIII